MSASTTAITTIAAAIITAILGPTIVDLIRNRLNKKKETSDDIMVKQMEVDVAVNTQLRILANQLKSDRIWISQFHNGGHFYTSGVSIKKFSLFHEVVSPGISIIQHQFQNTPTSFFSRALKEIFEKGDLTVANMDDLSVTSYGLRDTSQATGCKSTFLVSLKNSTGKFHGVLGVEYVKDTHKFTGKEKELIRDAAIYISGILSTIHK